jgi:malate synthase
VTPAQTENTRVNGPEVQGREAILTPEAVRFIARLATKFEPRRQALLAARRDRQYQLDEGAMPDFSRETAEIRQSHWRVPEAPADLCDRRVEITGPTDRKMIINALNSGANVFMADFEDSNSPTWQNIIEGQLNLRDTVNGTITYRSPEGKRYELNDKRATLVVRPRGWHLVEKHFEVDGSPVSGALFDFGLFFFHNARTLIGNGTAPYFYLPKMESRHEARLWNDVFIAAQDELGIARGTIRATVLVETILASFEMDEILWELGEHATGLNCGRWDYIFSYIKKFRNRADFMLPDRAQVTMTTPFLGAYVDLLIQTCHRRGAHAMGGMAAQIPIKNDASANRAALERVREDKLREVWAGHDGTWVAHPGLVPVAKEIFDTHMRFKNQLDKMKSCSVTPEDLVRPPAGTITERGLDTNLDVGLQYLAAWLSGNGCVPIYNLMEDAATAEICRAQVWQWLRHGAKLDNGATVSPGLVKERTERQLQGIRRRLPQQGNLDHAGRLFGEMTDNPEFPEFLTLRAYDLLP